MPPHLEGPELLLPHRHGDIEKQTRPEVPWVLAASPYIEHIVKAVIPNIVGRLLNRDHFDNFAAYSFVPGIAGQVVCQGSCRSSSSMSRLTRDPPWKSRSQSWSCLASSPAPCSTETGLLCERTPDTASIQDFPSQFFRSIDRSSIPALFPSLNWSP